MTQQTYYPHFVAFEPGNVTGKLSQNVQAMVDGHLHVQVLGYPSLVVKRKIQVTSTQREIKRIDIAQGATVIAGTHYRYSKSTHDKKQHMSSQTCVQFKLDTCPETKTQKERKFVITIIGVIFVDGSISLIPIVYKYERRKSAMLYASMIFIMHNSIEKNSSTNMETVACDAVRFVENEVTPQFWEELKPRVEFRSKNSKVKNTSTKRSHDDDDSSSGSSSSTTSCKSKKSKKSINTPTTPPFNAEPNPISPKREKTSSPTTQASNLNQCMYNSNTLISNSAIHAPIFTGIDIDSVYVRIVTRCNEKDVVNVFPIACLTCEQYNQCCEMYNLAKQNEFQQLLDSICVDSQTSQPPLPDFSEISESLGQIQYCNIPEVSATTPLVKEIPIQETDALELTDLEQLLFGVEATSNDTVDEGQDNFLDEIDLNL